MNRMDVPTAGLAVESEIRAVGAIGLFPPAARSERTMTASALDMKLKGFLRSEYSRVGSLLGGSEILKRFDISSCALHPVFTPLGDPQRVLFPRRCA